LPTFRFKFVVQAPLNDVWKFYTDVRHLEIITPKEIGLEIIRTSSQDITTGQEIWLSGKIIANRRNKWHSKITSMKEYEYVDEMITGPFKRWKHSHKFEDLGGSRTEIIDEILFELPYGIFGRLFEAYASNQLKKTFQHRELSTCNFLEKKLN